jgi:hypothetical protein
MNLKQIARFFTSATLTSRYGRKTAHIQHTPFLERQFSRANLPTPRTSPPLVIFVISENEIEAQGAMF